MSDEELSAFFGRMAAAGRGGSRETLEALDRKDWRSFEMWVAGRFQAAGWQVNDTPLSGDGGADVVCRHPKGGRSAIVQAKHRQMGDGTVGETAVHEMLAAPGRYRHLTWLREPLLLAVSNGVFELRARTLASQRNVRLVDRAEVAALDTIAQAMLTGALHLVGRRTGHTVVRRVAGFNSAGLAALVPGYGGGHPVR